MKKLLLYLVLTLACFTVSGQEILNLSGSDEIQLNSRYIEIFEDKSGQAGINEILNPAISSGFTKSETEFPLLKNTSSAYWLKFTAVSDLSRQYLVECFTFKINHLEIYIQGKNGKYEKSDAGNLKPFKQRNFDHKNFEFFLPVSKHPQTYYIRVKNSEPTRITLVIRSIQRFTGYALSEYFLLGLYYGIILIIAVYNIFMFLTIREKAHLWYVFYVISVGLYSMSQDGTGFQYFWPQFPRFNLYSTSIFLFSLLSWMLMYARDFLSVKELMPGINRIINIYLILRFTFLILTIFILPSGGNYILADLIPFALAYLCAFRSYKSGFQPAKYFIVGFSLLFTAFLITGLMYAKVIANNIFTVYAVNIGVVIEMVLLTVALAERVKIFREDKLIKERENLALEEMVQIRTNELEAANQKLKKQSEEIAQMNKLLYADNIKLADDVKRIAEDRVFQKQMNYDEFRTIYPDDNSCLSYLAGLKWDKGFKCSRCENDTFLNGKSEFSRRCTRCGYDESASAGTIFHGIKFPLTKAFYMLFLVSDNVEITVEQLSEKLELTTKTCWSFRKKITEALDNARSKKSRMPKWASIVLQNPRKSV